MLLIELVQLRGALSPEMGPPTQSLGHFRPEVGRRGHGFQEEMPEIPANVRKQVTSLAHGALMLKKGVTCSDDEGFSMAEMP